MNAPVIIKGNKQGIRLIINKEASLDDILLEVKTKLINTKNYYTNVKPINITFEGKTLTEDETELILDTLRNMGLNITEQNLQLIPYKTHNNDKKTNIPSEETGLFFIGDIRSGQSLESTKSIVIIGDVLQGASVVSEGNVVVIGRVKGSIISGSTGKKDAFVYCI